MCSIYDQYLEWRTRLGERLQPNSPILRIEFDTIGKVSVPKPVSSYVVAFTIRKLLDTTGVRALVKHANVPN